AAGRDGMTARPSISNTRRKRSRRWLRNSRDLKRSYSSFVAASRRAASDHRPPPAWLKQVVKSSRYVLTDLRPFDILVFGPAWWASDVIRSNMASHFGSGERIMRSDVRALLRPLGGRVGLLVVVALGVVACLLVLLVMVRGSYAEALPPLAGATAVLVAQRGRSY